MAGTEPGRVQTEETRRCPRRVASDGNGIPVRPGCRLHADSVPADRRRTPHHHNPEETSEENAVHWQIDQMETTVDILSRSIRTVPWPPGFVASVRRCLIERFLCRAKEKHTPCHARSQGPSGRGPCRKPVFAPGTL